MLESSKVPALTRAIDILNLIARIGPCSAATIIETLGIPKSTAYLLLSELKRQRFISVDHQENFCLWTKLVELSGHALSKMDLRELARPRLTKLMDETGLLCHLGIIDHESAYYILKVESSSTISVRSHEGKSLSLYRSGIGKCLLPCATLSLSNWCGSRRPPPRSLNLSNSETNWNASASAAGALITEKIIRMCAASPPPFLMPITNPPPPFRWSAPV